MKVRFGRWIENPYVIVSHLSLHPETSCSVTRASTDVIVAAGKRSPVSFVKIDSSRTSLQHSDKSSAVKSRTSLCLIIINPPLGQERA